jgi:hypothetical protein
VANFLEVIALYTEIKPNIFVRMLLCSILTKIFGFPKE